MLSTTLLLCLLVVGRLIGHNHNRIGLSLKCLNGSTGRWSLWYWLFQLDNGSDNQQHNHERQQNYSPSPLAPRHVEKALFHILIVTGC